MAEENVLMAFDRIGSTLLRASAERTVEAAHIRDVRSPRASPIISVHASLHMPLEKAAAERLITVAFLNKSSATTIRAEGFLNAWI